MRHMNSKFKPEKQLSTFFVLQVCDSFSVLSQTNFKSVDHYIFKTLHYIRFSAGTPFFGDHSVDLGVLSIMDNPPL